MILICQGQPRGIYVKGKVAAGILEFLQCGLGGFAHILPLESIKKLDLTPNDQSNFASRHNGCMPSGMKLSYNFPAAESIRLLKNALELKHLPRLYRRINCTTTNYTCHLLVAIVDCILM